MAETSKDELYEEAKRLKVEGRSEMTKDELEEAIAKAKTSGPVGAAEGEARSMHPDDDAALTDPETTEAIEKSWSRGADPEDAAAVAAAAEQARIANMGSTGGAALPAP